jgi:hypothetical protein
MSDETIPEEILHGPTEAFREWVDAEVKNVEPIPEEVIQAQIRSNVRSRVHDDGCEHCTELRALLEKHKAEEKARGIDDGPVLIMAKAGDRAYGFTVDPSDFYPFLRSVRPDLDPWRGLVPDAG